LLQAQLGRETDGPVAADNPFRAMHAQRDVRNLGADRWALFSVRIGGSLWAFDLDRASRSENASVFFGEFNCLRRIALRSQSKSGAQQEPAHRLRRAVTVVNGIACLLNFSRQWKETKYVTKRGGSAGPEYPALMAGDAGPI
jgi:hypothetical protein